MNVMTRIKLFLKDDEGQSTTEYILILSVVVMVAMKFRGTFLKKLGDITGKLEGDLDKAMTE